MDKVTVDAIIAQIEEDASLVWEDEILRIEGMNLQEALAAITEIITLEMESPLARGYCYRLLSKIAFG